MKRLLLITIFILHMRTGMDGVNRCHSKAIIYHKISYNNAQRYFYQVKTEVILILFISHFSAMTTRQRSDC